MQAYLTLGSEKHFRAAKNGFDFLATQSFATGGWGPDEGLSCALTATMSMHSLQQHPPHFETPCGSYAHFKLTRYLLRVTRESRYGDSMERMMYNTILGALPLQRDGRSFYYSDYNFQGSKVYCDHRWPCCSGTHPQVAADYRINTYLRDPKGVFVILYIPSTLTWKQDGTQVSLKQSGSYPFDNLVKMEITASQATDFTLNLRIPAWAQGASVSVNGKRTDQPAVTGSFLAVSRRWKTGDRIELELPLVKRLEAIDRKHPQTVALVSGPLVLFPITAKPPVVSGAQLLAAKKVAGQRWQAETASGLMDLLPFTAISDEQYSTYVVVS